MRKDDLIFAKLTSKRLASFEASTHPLPGIEDEEARRILIFQIVESIRRIRFVHQVAQRPIADMRKDPCSDYFDPIRAAISHCQAGNIDEAAWLIFLFVHFGKNAKSGYRLIADIYGRLGQKTSWTWAEVSKDPVAFRHWLHKNHSNLKTQGNNHRGFGNHRKYQSLDAWKANGTGEAIASYVSWVNDSGGHGKLFSTALALAEGDPERAFAHLYSQMEVVKSFGRTAKFDYLTMIGKVGLAKIRPDSVHFDGATGPLTGARLLFSGKLKSNTSNKQLESLANSLAISLKVDKQVIEDSLCNWQKSPTVPVRFRG